MSKVRDYIGKINNSTLSFKNVKSFYTQEVYIYAMLAMLPGWIIASILTLLKINVLTVLSVPIFSFILIFYYLIKLNNSYYLKEKDFLEHLLMVNKYDYTDLLFNFSQTLPESAKDSISQGKATDRFENFIGEIFGKNDATQIADLYVIKKGDILAWMKTLTVIQREKLYRHIISRSS